MPKISVVICCANVADTLAPACRSVQWADEVIVVDSGSTDATPQIARQLATRYLAEPWRGYTRQKQFGATLAQNDWVLVLDGDEECSPQLASQIQTLTDRQLQHHDVFLVRRKNYVMGRLVRSWWPDWQSRLIHRSRAQWADELFHDARLPSDPSRAKKLAGCLIHRRTSAAGFKDYFHGKQLDDRLLLIAKQMHDSGKRCRWWDLVFRPPHAFLKFYFLKLGFLDGVFGYIIAQRMAISAQLKYAALWTIQQNEKQQHAHQPGADTPPVSCPSKTC